MRIKQLNVLKEDSKGLVYNSDEEFKILYRKKGSVSGDNSKNSKETIYLISGEAEVTIEEETKNIKAPVKIEIKEKTYHKILALTDIIFILLD